MSTLCRRTGNLVNVLRSIIFNIVFFSLMGAFLLLGTPLLLLDEKYVFLFWHYLSKCFNKITEVIGGISMNIEGLENLSSTPAIYVVRHESLWETIMLIQLFHRPIFLLKKELLQIPVFGAMARKTKAIAVDRQQGVKALIKAAHRVKECIQQGHAIVIFPEGTRVPSGEYVPLKRGISLLYQQAQCPVIPIIHDAGRYWPRRGFIKKPGTVQVRIMPALEKGLPPEEFMQRLNDVFFTQIQELKRSNNVHRCCDQ